MSDQPPYRITPNMLAGVEEIGEAIGRAEAAGFAQDLRLRRANRIRSVQGTLAIEGNRLSQDQVAAILDGKPLARFFTTNSSSFTPLRTATDA